MSERNEPSLAALLTLAWPVVLSRSAQSVIGFCDALMTAPLGEDALAAATSGALNTFALLILPMGMAFIVQSFAAQLLGKDDLDGARRYGWYGLILAALTGVLTLVGMPAVAPALSFTPYTANVQALMSEYIELRLLSAMAVVGFEAIGNWYGGLGNTRIQMLGSLIMMVANVGLNALLIEGRLGCPALGVAGAAIASTIASWLGFVILLVLFVRRHAFAGTRTPTRLRLPEFVRMLRFGLPHGLNWFLEFAAFLVFIDVIVAEVGTVVVAALMVVSQVNSIAYMPSFGLASSGAIMAGQAVGRGRHDEVAAVLRLTMRTAIAWQLAVGLFYVALPSTIMQWFAPRGDDASTLVAVGAPLLAMSAAWQLFDAMALSCGEILRSAGDTAWPMWARLILAWVFFVPIGWLTIIELEGGGLAAVGCIIGYLAALAGLLMLRFRSGAWRAIEMTE
jgi:MATE family multidrug resistance protein